MRRHAVRAAIVLAAAALTLAIVIESRRAAPMFPRSDEALIQMATREALDGRQLLGAYSRFGWNHPGPLLFYLLAPFYALSRFNTAGLNAGALVINLAALGWALLVLQRRAGPALSVAFAVVIAFYLSRLDVLLTSSWNAHVDLVLCAAVLVAASAVAAGGLSLLPVLAVAASLAVQSHIAVLPLVASAGVLAVAPNLADASQRRTLRRVGLWTAGVLLLLWLPPLVDQITGYGNVGRMWAFIRNPPIGPAPGAEAYAAWARMLTAVPRGVLTLPGLPAPPDRAAWPLVAAPLEVLLLLAVAWWGRRRDRPVHMWLALQAAAASLVALAAVMRKPGEILTHEVFWITIIGVVAAAAMGGAALALLGGAFRVGRRWPQVAAATVGLVLFAGVAVEGFRQMQAVTARSHATDRYDRTVRDGAAAIDQELTRLGARRVTFAIDGRVWDTAAGMLLQLPHGGRTMVLDESQASMYPGARPPNGREDAELYFCGGVCHEQQLARPGNIVVFANDIIAIDVRRR